MTHFEFDPSPEPTTIGDITIVLCLMIVFASAAGLGWYVFEAVREWVVS